MLSSKSEYNTSEIYFSPVALQEILYFTGSAQNAIPITSSVLAPSLASIWAGNFLGVYKLTRTSRVSPESGDTPCFPTGMSVTHFALDTLRELLRYRVILLPSILIFYAESLISLKVSFSVSFSEYS